ncbi:hypothetical protein [Niallia circulans]|uniref:hypothetical protein n=1 Tax=Niallia circulans TaxID=1397 RepID=UPI0013DE4096|nr:hypothetical protein [Niallia circulans]
MGIRPKVTKKEDELPLYQLKWRGNQPNYRIYQPKWRGNQPNYRIYQPKWRENQPNYRIYQPKWKENQPNHRVYQPKWEEISQITDISAKPNKTPTKKPSSNPIGRAFFIITPKRISSRAYLLAYNI